MASDPAWQADAAPIPRRLSNEEPELEPYTLLYEDSDILVVDKLAPLPVQKDKSGDRDLQNLLREALPEKRKYLEAAHRLDRRTSGAVLFAKNLGALRELEKAFREHRIAKTYVACLEAEPIPPEGILIHLLRVSKQNNKTIALPWSPEPSSPDPASSPVSNPASGPASGSGSMAELSYRLILRSERYFFVEAEPKTGRHHQLRAQFAAIGCPIKGDLKYGSKRSCESGRIMLHARKLGFDHPRTKKRIDLVAPLPEDEALWRLLARSLE